jgi:hypothetical protein
MSDDYEVGYRKPPKRTRFQKGQSGNPFGRPRGSHNVLTDMGNELSGYITTQDGTKISKGRALIKALYAQAIKGNVRASALFLNKIPALAEFAVKEREQEGARAARFIREGLMELAMLGKQAKKEKEEQEKKEKEEMEEKEKEEQE